MTPIPTGIDPDDLHELIVRGGAPFVLDVRSGAEFGAGHVPGAINLPFWRLAFPGGLRGLPRDAPIVVYCGHGPRARLAAGLLRRAGFHRLSELTGHMAGWRRHRLPEERG
jgi:rhodanese-related sulfurtransferase